MPNIYELIVELQNNEQSRYVLAFLCYNQITWFYRLSPRSLANDLIIIRIHEFMFLTKFLRNLYFILMLSSPHFNAFSSLVKTR